MLIIHQLCPFPLFHLADVDDTSKFALHNVNLKGGKECNIIVLSLYFIFLAIGDYTLRFTVLNM